MNIIDNEQSQRRIYNQNLQRPPKSWLLESILVTLFCCLPFGIVGIVFAAKVDNAFYTGNFEEAQRLSREAGKWTKIGFGAGLVVMLGSLLLFLVGDLFSVLFNR